MVSQSFCPFRGYGYRLSLTWLFKDPAKIENKRKLSTFPIPKVQTYSCNHLQL